MGYKEKAEELIKKANQETTYRYQEYAGANYETFKHDERTLKSIALITVEEILKLYLDERIREFWINVKLELSE